MTKGLRLDGVNKVKAYRELRNKLKTIGTYKNKSPYKHLKTPDDFVNAVQTCATETRRSVAEKAALLWSLERLAREARVFDSGAFLLREPSIERFKAILHVGWGMDLFSDTGFDFSRFATILETCGDPKYRRLAMEPIGVMYTAAGHPLRSSFIGIKIPPFPNSEALQLFFHQFNEPERQMISHGYGRGLYFKLFSLPAALKQAMKCPRFFDSGYAVRGVAFAFTMVNNSYPKRIFLTARTLAENNAGREACRYFGDGISSALSFLEWNSAGHLETLEENSIIASAKKMVKTYHADGGVFKL